jgi:serine/threonine protein kinase
MVTLWYRAPEVLLGLPYGAASDVWSLGCVAGELLLGKPLFPGRTVPDLLRLIAKLLGSPNTMYEHDLIIHSPTPPRHSLT